MDWTAAIDKNRETLKRVLVGLVAMARIAERSATLPRILHRAVLRLLRPAEAAARRLVIVAARGIEVALPPLRAARAGRSAVATTGTAAPRPASLPLFDPPSRWGRPRRPTPTCVPRISFPGITAQSPVRRPPMPFDPLDATRLGLRLAALGHALDDLPRQAARFARWRAMRASAAPRNTEPAAVQNGHRAVRRVWPLRPGRPPGQRPPRDRRPAHDIHHVLNTVHGLALWAMEPADTS